jgi:hypothetical protein
MEELCTPTRRYKDIWEEFRDDDPFEYIEVALAIPVEDFLVNRWDWNDLRAFLTEGVQPKLLWITECSFLVVEESGNEFEFGDDGSHSCIGASFQEISGREQTLTLASIGYLEMPGPTASYNVFWHAITTSNSVKLSLREVNNPSGLPPGSVLSQFFRGSPSLRALDFHGFDFTEEHCRSLATLERMDLEVKLTFCTFERQNAEDTFIEWFRHNQVVTELTYCNMGCRIISTLSGNNSVKGLTINRLIHDFGEEEMCSLLEALPGNMGIEHLTIRDTEMSDETWSLIFRSLSTHPRINFMSIYRSVPRYSAEARISDMNAILQMLRLNTVVHKIELPDTFRDEEVYRNSIIPRLEMNCSYFRVQRQALKRADPSIRSQLLGRALHVVRYNPNLAFQFLSENVPAFVRTEVEEAGDSIIPLENDAALVAGQKRKKPS